MSGLPLPCALRRAASRRRDGDVQRLDRGAHRDGDARVGALAMISADSPGPSPPRTARLAAQIAARRGAIAAARDGGDASGRRGAARPPTASLTAADLRQSAAEGAAHRAAQRLPAERVGASGPRRTRRWRRRLRRRGPTRRRCPGPARRRARRPARSAHRTALTSASAGRTGDAPRCRSGAHRADGRDHRSADARRPRTPYGSQLEQASERRAVRLPPLDTTTSSKASAGSERFARPGGRRRAAVVPPASPRAAARGTRRPWGSGGWRSARIGWCIAPAVCYHQQARERCRSTQMKALISRSSKMKSARSTAS